MSDQNTPSHRRPRPSSKDPAGNWGYGTDDVDGEKFFTPPPPPPPTPQMFTPTPTYRPSRPVRSGMVGPREALRAWGRGLLTFSGRTSRAGFWWVVLTINLVLGAVMLAFSLLGNVAQPTLDSSSNIMGILAGFIIVVLAVLLVIGFSQLALTVRRFHDVGLSGWWYGGAILIQIPLVFLPGSGLLVFIAVTIVCVLPSQSGANRFGYPQ